MVPPDTTPRRTVAALIGSAVSLAAVATVATADPGGEALEHFEREIRPLLAERCYECHSSSGKRKAGLAVDSRAGLLEGGESGPAVVPGDPQASLLLDAIAHAPGAPEMPKNGPRFTGEEVAHFRRWIEDGAVDPRDAPPSAEAIAEATSWEAVRERREEWWSFQPVADPAPPQVSDPGWTQNRIDAFILARLEREGIEPAPRAGRRTLVRRLSFVLTGVPPTPEEVEAFVDDPDVDAYEQLVDRLLASPRFGEKWARHWMDWVRYAESHGSEGDPRIPHAPVYRDYLIRALNADVPYDQLVREHLAGDLMDGPRVNRELGLNESAIGPAHLRFVFHGFAPTDPLDELVRFTDNQIDVVTKAFLGLTVSCARCHDHKFDAISQKDFYALFGVFASCRPAVVGVDAPGVIEADAAGREAARERLRESVFDRWERSAGELAERLAGRSPGPNGGEVHGGGGVLGPWRALAGKRGGEFREGWSRLVDEARASRERIAHRFDDAVRHWRLGDAGDHASWFTRGAGVGEEPDPAGTLRLAAVGDRLVEAVLPSGAHSGLDSSKLNAVVESPRIPLDGAYQLWVRAAGNAGQLRYVVRNYPRSGTVYPVRAVDDTWRWIGFDLGYWEGDQIHVELSTAGDSPVLAKGGERSWVGLREVALVPAGAAAPQEEIAESLAPLLLAGTEPSGPEDLAALYAGAAGAAVRRCRDGSASDADALFVDGLMGADLLESWTCEFPESRSIVRGWRSLEAEVPVPARAPGVVEAGAFDQPLFVRGNHKQPAEPVPRRFLEAFGGREYRSAESGRRELAEDIIGSNPLAARVIANRLWHHVFGRGIVPTTDNFGRLGALPSHPELLDHLAGRMKEGGWSIKGFVRELVLAESFRMRPGRHPGDPEGALLSAFPVRRLEAEAVRDSLLAVSGGLDETMFGAAAGGDSGRRSVYVRAIRNNPDPFLRTFDAPEPMSTRGRRDSTNVPAQSLAMMNSPLVARAASGLARQVEGAGPPDQRVRALFSRALGRLPDVTELAESLRFVQDAAAERDAAAARARALRAELGRARASLTALVDPVRQRLLETKLAGEEAPVDPVVALRPFAVWEFDGDGRDSAGGLHAELSGDARIEDGALVLGGAGHATTPAIDRDLREKTLEAWVQLESLDQRGGGGVTVQSPDGGVFDSIVFGEQMPRHWIAGSNHFERTKSFGGAEETDAATSRFVHLAVTYAVDGTITAFRDGDPYGNPYRTGVHGFAAGRANVLFGLRHSPPQPGRFLQGRIDRARLYDRALSAEEVAASASAGAVVPVSGAELAAALGEAGRAERERLQSEIGQLEAELEDVEADGADRDPWEALAHAVLNLKEFIYLQ